MQGKSIGFLPLKVHVPDDKEVQKNHWGDRVGLVIDEWLLLEYACVFLPANQEALVESVSKGALELSPDLLAALGGIAPVVRPALGEEQQQRVIGFLSRSSPDTQTPFVAAMRTGLAETGYVEGKSLTLDHRAYGTKPEQATALAAALVQSGDEVIVASGGPAIVAAQAATRTIPILGTADDMVASGLVPSLARPGGNLGQVSAPRPWLQPSALPYISAITASIATPRASAWPCSR